MQENSGMIELARLHGVDRDIGVNLVEATLQFRAERRGRDTAAAGNDAKRARN